MEEIGLYKCLFLICDLNGELKNKTDHLYSSQDIRKISKANKLGIEADLKLMVKNKSMKYNGPGQFLLCHFTELLQ